MSAPINLLEDLKPGKSFRIRYDNKNNVNNRVIHIRAIVDDEMIVFRQWSRRRQRWIYAIEHLYYFELINTGVLQRRQ